MSAATVADFIQLLTQSGILDATQQGELPRLHGAFPDPRALAGELVKRGWLTPFQANQLFKPAVPRLRVGPFVLLDRLGAGGMGEVFRARNRLTGKVVALKLIRENLAADSETSLRFLREIRAATTLAHPNIITAHHADQEGDTLYLVMEYVEGQDLQKLIKQRGPLPAAEACEYARQAALGLQHAHERGLIHRDIKPSNLLRAASGELKVLDLGLARPAVVAPGMQGMTQTGTVLGTPDYLAPEQALDARSADIRSDIYSLGCTLYHLLAGQPPFPDGTLTQKLIWHQQAHPATIESLRRDVPAGVGAVLHRMMAKRPQDRFQTPADVAAALIPFCQQVSVLPPGQLGQPGVPANAPTEMYQDRTPASLIGGAPAAPERGWTLAAGSTIDRGAPAEKAWTLSLDTSAQPVPPPRRRRRLLLACAAGGLVQVVLLVLLLRGGREPATPPDKAGPGQGAAQPFAPIAQGPLTLEMIDRLGVKRQVTVQGMSSTLGGGSSVSTTAQSGNAIKYRLLLDQGHGLVLAIPWDAVRKVTARAQEYVVTLAGGTEYAGAISMTVTGEDGKKLALNTMSEMTVLKAGALPAPHQPTWRLTLPEPVNKTYRVCAPRFEDGFQMRGEKFNMRVNGKLLEANFADFERVAVMLRDGRWQGTVTVPGGEARTGGLEVFAVWRLRGDLADGTELVLEMAGLVPGFVLERLGAKP